MRVYVGDAIETTRALGPEYDGIARGELAVRVAVVVITLCRNYCRVITNSDKLLVAPSPSLSRDSPPGQPTNTARSNTAGYRSKPPFLFDQSAHLIPLCTNDFVHMGLGATTGLDALRQRKRSSRNLFGVAYLWHESHTFEHHGGCRVVD